MNPLDNYRDKTTVLRGQDHGFKAVVFGKKESFPYSGLLVELEKRNIQPHFISLSQESGESLDFAAAQAFSPLKDDLSVLLY